ncbi:hypothetical protein COEREDRAFT_80868 [Coemansia reversa NRRL 1564]|uniref:Uncharacterized protein n=1 Tax=Coemansia reversa (strain ATCC 12441 / NRRL 1564) TaxID=763665 RepID=A0A2G5BCP7_COERN|nr:hypothetical protein COEREDRAFT_80868 [Coemansia reversa NRRL 1564]|eukprot:PIA16788.1 hypothetical protein COEREDRAFT_80868 [Coemansia reversa NRRL 1564]
MAGEGGNSGETSPSKINRLLSRLSRTMTPPKTSIRSRRGISPTQQLEVGAVGVAVPSSAPNDRAAGEDEYRYHYQQQRHETINEETLRRRQKIAELRGRREKEYLDRQRRQTQQTQALFSPEADNAVGFDSAVPFPLNTLNMSMAAFPGTAEYEQMTALRTPETREAERFIESRDMDLLLQPIDTESMLNVVDPTPPSQRVKQEKRDQRHSTSQQRLHRAVTSGRRTVDEMDFTINIPSTSLSPMMPLHPVHGRQRSRATVFYAEKDLEKFAENNRNNQGLCSHTALNTAISSRESKLPDALCRQIEVELRRNASLKHELAQLDASIRAISSLLLVADERR